MKSLTEAKVNSSARIILYFFAFKAHNFFNKSLFDGSKSVVIVGCVLYPSIFGHQNKIESTF